MEQNQFENAKPNRKWMYILIIVIVIVASYLVYRSKNESSTGAVIPTETPTPTNSPVSQGAVKIFTVVGQNFSFSTSEIRVKKGDTVKIIFQNNDGVHDWVIDEFNARTARIQSGQKAEIQFVADKTGQFEYYCSVGSHRAQGMKGVLIVE